LVALPLAVSGRQLSASPLGSATEKRGAGVPLADPWFWAFLAVLGWALAFGLIGTQTLGRRLGFGIAVFILAEVPRLVLPLPFVSQPRVELSPAFLVPLGALILIGSLYFAAPVFRIVPLTGPNQREPLRTDGLYSIVRHPLMVCDIFWPLGWSLLFGSAIGVLLTPAWLAIIWVGTYVEEESLVREYGEAYREFQARVPRLFPRISVLLGRRAA
jgi:protein-S-isoprenylcysteine O-methyltransferase Ste14